MFGGANMTVVMGLTMIGAGIAALLVGTFGKKFYQADPFGGDLKEESSRRSGRILFYTVGITFVAMGIGMLFGVVKPE